MQIQPVIVRADKWTLSFIALLSCGIPALIYWVSSRHPPKTMVIDFGPATFTMLESMAGTLLVSGFIWLFFILPMMLWVGLQRVIFRNDSLTYATVFGQQNIFYAEIRDIELVKIWRQGAPAYFLYLAAERDERHQIPFAAFSRHDCVRILEIVLRCCRHAQVNDSAHQFIEKYAPR